jgi:hypothetical protein
LTGLKNKWRKTRVSEKWCKKVTGMCKKDRVRPTTQNNGVSSLSIQTVSRSGDGCTIGKTINFNNKNKNNNNANNEKQ